MRLRIIIQSLENGNHKHLSNIMVDGCPSLIEKKIRFTIKKENQKAKDRFLFWLEDRKKGFLEELVEEMGGELLDLDSVGSDITPSEFLENEIWFEMNT